MPPIHLLIKPASSNCNLRCRYCFYHSIADNRAVKSYGIMEESLTEVLVKNAIDYADDVCTFAFQGGEPTLAGLNYFKRFIELVDKYNTKSINISYAIQTNGMVINDEWAEFLAKNNFLVGLSLDGNKDINDNMRVDSNNKGSYQKIMNTVNLFNKYNVQYNILSVITENVARYTNKIYSFFKKNNFQYMQFIPCLDPLGEEPGKYPHSLTPERYAYFLKSLFNLWYEDVSRGVPISIRYFDNLVTMLVGYPPESCGMSGVCESYCVIEADGGVYPCDFYVTDEWYLGNIKDYGFEELKNCEVSKKFVNVSKHISDECKSCRWFRLCNGGCRRNREPFIDGHPALNYYCSSYKEFFEYSYERLVSLARMISSRMRR